MLFEGCDGAVAPVTVPAVTLGTGCCRGGVTLGTVLSSLFEVDESLVIGVVGG